MPGDMPGDVPGEGSFRDERVRDERAGDGCSKDDRSGDGDSSGAPGAIRTPEPTWSEWRGDARSDGRGRRTGAFDALGAPGPFGAASISLLLNMLVERTRSQAWSVERQRAHARVLIELARDHWFTDEETAVLCAFLR